MVRAANTYPELSLAERDRRWGLLRRFLEEQGLDCLVVAGPLETRHPDRYITNFLTGWVVFPKAGAPVLITPRGYAITQALEIARMGEAPMWVTDLRHARTGRELGKHLKSLAYERSKIGVVGLSMGELSVEGWIPYRTWADVLEELPNASFIDVTRPYVELVSVKSEEELQMVRKAADVAELACEEMLRVVKPGIRESDVVAAVMNVVYGHGCVGSLLPHLGPLILQSGPSTFGGGPPRWVTRGGEPRMLKKGDFLRAEIFSIYGGYEAQAHMYISLGTPDDNTLRAAEVARASYDEGVKALMPGALFSGVKAAMEKPFAGDAKVGTGTLIHSLNICYFSSESNIAISDVAGGDKLKWAQSDRGRGGDIVIQAGMVFEVEPKCSVNGRVAYLGGTVVVTEKGAVELNEISTRIHTVKG
ncbi:MAG: aminopeptidase P family protein [Chloroflexi bacterium]|nr:aminopeptidase P family protein [Chloroflexota bacterium]